MTKGSVRNKTGKDEITIHKVQIKDGRNIFKQNVQYWALSVHSAKKKRDS